jgi:integrase
MPNVFKKSIVRYLDAEGRQVPKGTPGARRVKERSTKYYGRTPGAAKPVPLCTNKSAAQIMLNEMVKEAETAAALGIKPTTVEHRKKPLSEHLAAYRRDLEALGRAPRYVAVVASRLEALLKGCEFVFIPDLSASKVTDWLSGLREKGRERSPLDKEFYTKRELASALGVKPHCLPGLIRRWGLSVSGQGKARRFPRATAEALQDRLCRGASVETTNQYLSHIKAFCRWLVKDGRMSENPLAHLEAGNVQVDRRHDRRELTEAELRTLLAVTKMSEKSFRVLTGQDRFHLYATACGTGFRASALASLTPESFDLNPEKATVTLAARENKSRKTRVQPLPADVAELLREYVQGKPAGKPLWGGTWARDGKGADMLRTDLDAAGIPYAVEGPDGPLHADFHALRHTYLTLGGRAGIDLRTLQELAGHSTPTLTARYSHRRLFDLQGAVEMLPSFLPSETPEAASARATGTEVQLPSSCPPVAQTADSGCGGVRTNENAMMLWQGEGASHNPLGKQPFESHCDGMRAAKTRVGEGTRTPDIQLCNLKIQI